MVREAPVFWFPSVVLCGEAGSDLIQGLGHVCDEVGAALPAACAPAPARPAAGGSVIVHLAVGGGGRVRRRVHRHAHSRIKALAARPPAQRTRSCRWAVLFCAPGPWLGLVGRPHSPHKPPWGAAAGTVPCHRLAVALHPHIGSPGPDSQFTATACPASAVRSPW